jgi:hypothetical protein
MSMIVTNESLIAEAQRCRALLAYDAALKGEDATAKIIAEISFSAQHEPEITGEVEQTIEGLAQTMRVKEILMAAARNLDIYGTSEITECGPYAWCLRWEEP